MYIKPLFIILTTFCVTAQAWVIDKGDSSKWLVSRAPAPSVYSEMNKYFIDYHPGTDARAYVSHFITSMHVSLVNEAEYTLAKKLKETTCSSDIKVTFPETLTQGYNFQGQHEFESEVLKIQSYDCLGKLNLHTVFETLMSDAFQRKTIDGLKFILSNQKNNQVCQKVSIFPLGTSHYCFTQHILATSNQYIIHSYNEANIEQPSAPAYFREAVTIFTQLPNGEVSVYNLAYARGPDLPVHSIVKKVITQRQQTSIQDLIETAK